jgi:hypothetical protein
MFIRGTEVYRSKWKRNKTLPKGFSKSFRQTTPSGDELQVDYNFHENLVRLSLSVSLEKGRNYITTIKNGTIIRERDVSNGMNSSLKKKFLPFREIFSSIPDNDILETIGGVYEIEKQELQKYESDREIEVTNNSKEEKLTKIHFKDKLKSFYRNLRIRILDDLYDTLLGISLCVAIYLHFFDMVLLGFSLGFMGLFFGTLDWTLRSRNPMLLKVLSFLFSGGYYFYLGYTRF